MSSSMLFEPRPYPVPVSIRPRQVTAEVAASEAEVAEAHQAGIPQKRRRKLSEVVPTDALAFPLVGLFVAVLSVAVELLPRPDTPTLRFVPPQPVAEAPPAMSEAEMAEKNFDDAVTRAVNKVRMDGSFVIKAAYTGFSFVICSETEEYTVVPGDAVDKIARNKRVHFFNRFSGEEDIVRMRDMQRAIAEANPTSSYATADEYHLVPYETLTVAVEGTCTALDTKAQIFETAGLPTVTMPQ